MIEPDDEAAGRDPYYTRSSATSGDIPRLVVKCDDAFVVSDDHGDFPKLPESEFGFYVGGTRFLRHLDLAVHGQRPLLLGAAVADDGRQLAADLTNPDLSHGEILLLKGHTLRLARRLALGPSELTEVLSVESFGCAPHELLLSWRYAADFADVFEVRGMVREQRGELLPPVTEAGAVGLSYRARRYPSDHDASVRTAARKDDCRLRPAATHHFTGGVSSDPADHQRRGGGRRAGLDMWRGAGGRSRARDILRTGPYGELCPRRVDRSGMGRPTDAHHDNFARAGRLCGDSLVRRPIRP
jgi:hypothetical protein